MSLDSETKIALAEELEDVAMELANISQLSTATSALHKEKKELKQRIQAETERLNDIAELYEYQELIPITTWVHSNVLALGSISEQLIRKNEAGIFYLWIELLAALLQEQDNELLAELKNALLDSDWDISINLQDLQQLLASLAPIYEGSTEQNKTTFASETYNNTPSEDDFSQKLIITPTTQTRVEETPQESSYRLAPDDDVHPELLEAFFLETPDQVIEVAELIRMISAGEGDKEIHQSAARIAHTIKGSSAVVGIDTVASFAHKLEDILEYSVDHPLPPETADLLVESADCLESMFDSLLTQSQPPQQYPQLLEQLIIWDRKFSSGFIYEPPVDKAPPSSAEEIIEKPKKKSLSENNSDYSLGWDKNVHPELLDAYMGETPEHVVEIAQLLRDISQQKDCKTDSDLSECYKKASRLAHTIKGTSAVVGIHAVADLGQPLEEILDYAVEHSVPTRLSKLLNESADLLESLYDSLLSESTPPEEYPSLYKKLCDWQQYLSEEEEGEDKLLTKCQNQQKQDNNKTQIKTPPIADTAVKEKVVKKELSKSKNDSLKNTDNVDNSEKFNLNLTFRPLEEILPVASIDTTPPKVAPTPVIQRGANLNETSVRVPVSVIDQLLNFSSELITTNTQISDQIRILLQERHSINEHNERIRQMLDELEWAVNQQTTLASEKLSITKEQKQTKTTDLKENNTVMDSLEMDSYNELHSITGLLSESVEDNHKMSLSLTQRLNELKAQAHHQKQISNELNANVLSMRMESVKILAPRLQRIVRETCRQTQKKAQLEIIGDELALDTDIIKGLVDPLLHLLRNAIDHGIETEEVRAQKGKDKTGKLQLKFIQQGDQVILTLKDDGVGIDADKVYQAAIKKELITAKTKLSHNEKLRLILRPSFSTRDTVTETSGRGVGMDVVNSAVKNLSGNITIRSDKDKGSEIQIQVPLTLSAANILLVDILGNTLAIPNALIEQVYYLTPNSIQQQDGKTFIRYQQQKIPLLALSTLLSWPSSKFISDKSQSVLIVKHQGQFYALYTDQILKPLNITIKTLKPWMTNVTGVSGVCLLPNGVVAPVLNLIELLRAATPNTLNKALNITDSKSININQDKILVVDDSLSNRTALRLMLEALGHKVCTAVDGADALQQIEKSLFKLVITDLEMPNMNGLEMVESLRSWSATRKLPIIMVTSRSTSKHRKLATQAGIDDYLTKPVDTSTLQSTIDKYITYKSLNKVEQS